MRRALPFSPRTVKTRSSSSGSVRAPWDVVRDPLKSTVLPFTLVEHTPRRILAAAGAGAACGRERAAMDGRSGARVLFVFAALAAFAATALVTAADVRGLAGQFDG